MRRASIRAWKSRVHVIAAHSSPAPLITSGSTPASGRKSCGPGRPLPTDMYTVFPRNAPALVTGSCAIQAGSSLGPHMLLGSPPFDATVARTVLRAFALVESGQEL